MNVSKGLSGKKPITPIFIKTDSKPVWPQDQIFYLLAGNGLFRCRNTEFFTSCVKAEQWPNSLTEQKQFVKIGYPYLPRRLLELIVGFFSVVYDIHRAEAAVIILWDRSKQRYRLLVPPQTSKVLVNLNGMTYPLNVQYETPVSLPANTFIIGDAHSHCDESAYASLTDQNDETYRTGIHIVVGRINQDPPEFHIEAVVDGARFHINDESLLEGYKKRRMKIPNIWINQVKIKTFGNCQDYSNGWIGGGYNDYDRNPNDNNKTTFPPNDIAGG